MSDLPMFSSAQWLQSSIRGERDKCAPVPYFRKSFTLERLPKSATLVITALGLYECEINGQPVTDAVFAPGWTNYANRVQVQRYDVTELLRVGENAIGAILGDGWYCGFVGLADRRQVYGDRPRLLACLHLEGGAEISTDASWKTNVGPILEADLLMGESYDARRELGAWSSPGYDDSAWNSVEIGESYTGEFATQVAPPVRRISFINPVEVRENAVGSAPSRIFDLGQNFSGRVKVSAKGASGETMTLRFAEVLMDNGELYTENLRSARCTDYYTFKGAEEGETWEPRFTFHGFRYVEVSGVPLDVPVEVTGIVLHSDTPPTGRFRCSNELLNQLQHNIVWGQKSNFLEVPTDCPQRNERLGWTGDAQVFVRTAAFNMDVRNFFHKWMLDARDSQGPKGSIPSVLPNPVYAGDHDGGPAWSDATIICPWTIYLCYADLEILRDHYDSMRRYMSYMAEIQTIGHIRVHPDLKERHCYGDWLALDGSGFTDGATPKDLIGTAFYAYDAEIMAKVSELLGHTQEAKRYRALHAEIKEAFQRRYLTPEGLVASGTQTSMVLALHFGLVPLEVQTTTVKELVHDIERRKFHLATGFVGTPYLLEVLNRHGYRDVAYKLLEQETYPSWLFPVKNGATTIWERWDGWTPEKGFQDPGMNSFNHYAYGAVGAWMYSAVAGLELDPEEPGYKRIIFQPQPGGTIQWAEAELETPHGRAAIRWELTGDDLQVQVEVPEGARGTFQAPADYLAETTELTPGKHRLACKKR